LMHGAGLGAVYTVTSLPPACGVNAIDRTFTPIVAQSSAGASLTIKLTVPFCDCGVVFRGLELELPDEHPMEKSVNAAEAAPSITRA